MITGLDHIAVATRDFDAAVRGYGLMLGREPQLQAGGGAKRAWFRVDNTALEVIAPDGEGHPVAAQLDAAGEGQWLCAFAVDDVAATAKLFARRGLAVETEDDQAWVRAAGLTFVLCAARDGAGSPGRPEQVSRLDHVVVSTPNADRALAVYGARFGLDLRLDRENAGWGARQQFFRCGSSVFEVAASLKSPPTDAPDRFGGLAWGVADPDAVHARLAAAGFNVSELRTGRKPGTKVFTVRHGPEGTSLAGVPTIMIQQTAQDA